MLAPTALGYLHINSPVPHLLLPALLFTSLYVPPFPHRGILFSAAIGATLYACAVDAFPVTLQNRYALGCLWLFYFPVLEKLLLHHDAPEHDFWRLDRAPREAEAMPAFSWEKARWAAALAANPRGVGWNYGSSRLRPVQHPDQSRLWFVVTSIAQGLAASCAVEICMMAYPALHLRLDWGWAELPKVVCAELMMAVVVFSTWQIQVCNMSALGVGLGLSSPGDWPPFWGELRSCYTVAAFWGDVWHAMLRQPALAVSHRITDSLGLKKQSPAAYAVHIGTAFFLSSLGHIISLLPVIGGLMTVPELCRDISLFFMGQAAVIVAESLVLKALQSPGGRGKAAKADATKGDGPVEKKTRGPLLGYAWVATWLLWSGWWFVRVYVKIGSMEWKGAPPIVKTLLAALRRVS